MARASSQPPAPDGEKASGIWEREGMKPGQSLRWGAGLGGVRLHRAWGTCHVGRSREPPSVTAAGPADGAGASSGALSAGSEMHPFSSSAAQGRVVRTLSPGSDWPAFLGAKCRHSLQEARLGCGGCWGRTRPGGVASHPTADELSVCGARPPLASPHARVPPRARSPWPGSHAAS